MATIPVNLTSEVLAKYSFDENTLCFSAVSKDNPKDKIEIEIGDSKEPAILLPQFKLMRWDNETNVSIRLKDFDNYSVMTDKNKIILGQEDKEAHFYNIEPCEEHPEGGYEFEVVLKKKPKTNKIEFTLVDKDVEYFYQPELTPEEIEQGASRPDEVVGSYAIYAKTPKTNWVGGKEYKCGKVGHIYRPKIIDAKGTEVWGDLHIENGILSVTIPQQFIDEAAYPIRHAAGLTFGYTTGQTSSQYSGRNSLALSKFTLSENGVVSKLTIYTQNYTDPTLMKGLIYSDNAGYPDQLLITPSEISTGTHTSGGWVDLIASVSLNAGTYWLGYITPTTSNYVSSLSSGGNGTAKVAGTYATPETTYPSGAALDADGIISIYATYTAGGASTKTQINIGDAWKTVTGMQINIGDAWKAVTHVWQNIGDVWKTVF